MKHLPLRVDTDLSLDEVTKTMGGTRVGPDAKIKGVALDTRAVQPGDLFFALKASRDGHKFVAQALENGAVACVVHEDVDANGIFIRVKNTHEALAKLGNYKRKKWNKTVVAISGSNGKTTTKEMTAAVLGTKNKVLKTPGNWNNNLGVPLTLLQLRDDHDVAVLELGINDFGEMKALTEMSEPSIAILTTIGPVHLEKLGSLEGVAKAKGELFEALSKNSYAVINMDDVKLEPFSRSISAQIIKISLKGDTEISAQVVRDLGSDGLVLKVRYGSESAEIKTPFVGIHNVYNLMCAFGAALVLKIPAKDLQAGVDAIQRPEMRMEVLQVPRNIRLVNDCYNANPGSMMVALEVVRNFATGRYMAALGDMLELGDFAPRAHRDLGIKVASYKYSLLFVIGQFSGDVVQGAVQGGMRHDHIRTFKNQKEMATAIVEKLEPNDTVLVKGSRGMKMELVTEEIRRQLSEGGLN